MLFIVTLLYCIVDYSHQLNPRMTRIRCVARKRYNLSDDIVKLFASRGHSPSISNSCTFIGHTRFATSSQNYEPELHPHEWCPFKDEVLWMINPKSKKFERVVANFGIHISHNGDFDALNCYNQLATNEEVGLWLERVLHQPNHLNGDSPKIAGCLDLMRVQGRWAAASRMAFVRTTCQAITDVAGGTPLSKTSDNVFPGQKYWFKWEQFFEGIWVQHVNNVIKVSEDGSYSIDKASLKQLIASLIKAENKPHDDKFHNFDDKEAVAFINTTVRGFLYADLYTSLTEFISRAEGSFGIQVHCAIEPG